MYKDYLTPSGHHKKTREVITYEEFLSRITWMTEHTGNVTIGGLNGRASNPTTLFWVLIPQLGKFRVHADSKLTGLKQLLTSCDPNVVISKRGARVLSTLSKAITGVYIYLEN